ncbi:transporter substrate-binding domain-containing protein [Streptomyces sp. NBC_00053]|uniref:caspase, EACC1-associated type n=1 Tax=unclassified Streptomyces TaxID=2593676 RepID=UPI000F5BB6F5|nr:MULTISPECIES: transporter substrate-binding domain-containing protein [unclassified Streptomyces]MCX5500214.1 transporter substrate-binding domain-containing protein [Streptomyces sp. NBC_00052]MCX5551250.1 transporter substrate-binding domain-containing protein [Streptomyces sp. NBC_00051]WSG50549.1 transporter substrate-binding domain-containing protein [Streptomyces sp. NBC_01732]WSX01205.1 transporter substrate-binding domain-containing protein [Streptomyces sp. NBC_00987]
MSTPKQHSAEEDRELTTPLAGVGLPDPAGTRVVLIGAGRFSELDPLPATRRNVKDLADLLADAWSLPVGNCTVLCDPKTPRDLSRAVEAAAREATDTLLVYYAGHGVIDRAGHYHLAVRETERESVHDTAAPYEWIKAHIEKSRAERRIVILDCCYAARAFGLQSNAAALEVAGTYILAAAGETATAISPPGETYTAFTDALLTVLSKGVSGLPRYLNLDSVFSQLSKELARRSRPRPAQLWRDHLGRAPFIKNAAYQPPSDTLRSAPPAQRASTAETSKDGGEPRMSPTPATVRTGEAGPSAVPPGKKPVPVLRRKIVRYVGLPTVGLALLFGGWSAYAVSSVSYEDSPLLQKIHRERGFIRVGVKGDQPGLAKKVGKEWVGFEIDLARKIAANLGFTKKEEVVFVEVFTNNRVTTLQSGDVDFVVATWSMNGPQAEEARKDEDSPLDFVGPYYTASLGALVLGTEQEAQEMKGIDDIKDKFNGGEEVCTASGSTSEEYLKKHGVEPKKEESYKDCWDRDSVKVVITDDIILAGLNEDEDFSYLTPKVKGRVVPLRGTAEKYGIGIRAGDPIFNYLACQVIQKGWKSSVDKNLEKMATRQLGKWWTPPIVDFPECSRLEVWKYKLLHVL